VILDGEEWSVACIQGINQITSSLVSCFMFTFSKAICLVVQDLSCNP